MPTLEDVARAAGVSRATVSRVVNGAPNVSSDLQRVVLEAIAAVGYVPNRAARQLITGRSGVIALVMSIVPEPGSRELALDGGRGGVSAGGSSPTSRGSALDGGRGGGDGSEDRGEHGSGGVGALAGAVSGASSVALRGSALDRDGAAVAVAVGGEAADPVGTEVGEVLNASGVGPAALRESSRDDGWADTSSDSSPARVFADPFFGRIVAGVLGFLRPRHLHPLLMLAEDEQSRAQVLDDLRQGAADGALVVSIDPADPLPGLLVEAGLPAVFFARPERPMPVRYVDLAHQDGGRLAAERLLALGRRRVGVIAGPLALHAGRARLDGFCETMARHGVAYVPYLVGNFTQDSGERAMRELLEREPRLDGVFAANDLMAVGALHVLLEGGRRVPQDVAVIGFDDSSAATSARPRLTTVRQPVEAMAARMAGLLLERLDAPDAPPRAVLFDAELVVRASG